MNLANKIKSFGKQIRGFVTTTYFKGKIEDELVSLREGIIGKKVLEIEKPDNSRIIYYLNEELSKCCQGYCRFQRNNLSRVRIITPDGQSRRYSEKSINPISHEIIAKHGPLVGEYLRKISQRVEDDFGFTEERIRK